jgi:hypothetical protein
MHHVAPNIPEPSLPWPRLVAWLAVMAHFCVADVIGVSSRSSDSDLSLLRSAAVLLAQADLLVVWLVLGTSLWVRRLPWSLCGFCGVGLVFQTVFKGEFVALGGYLAHVASTAAVVGFLRWRGKRIGYTASPTVEIDLRSRHQFTILDLFGAALGTAIAVSWLLRMESPQSSPRDQGAIVMLTALLLPLAGLTLTAAIGMRRQRWLAAQIVLAALIAIFAPKDLTIDSPRGFCLLYAVHWFLVAATLWIFQRCGYRLAEPAGPM